MNDISNLCRKSYALEGLKLNARKSRMSSKLGKLAISQMMQRQQMKQLFEMTQGMMFQHQQQSASFVALFEKFATKLN